MTYQTKLFLYLLLCLRPLILTAQPDQATSLKVSYANDFFTGTDRYFTQGIRIELFARAFRKTPVRLLGTLFRENNSASYSLALQQDGYTPTSIQRDTLLNHDRPFCGSLFITNSEYIVFEKRKLMLHSQLSLGAIGPLALGYEEQTAIHKAINNVLPRGWKNEIQNDLILNYKLEIQQTMIHHKFLDLIHCSQIRAGTLFTDLGIGGEIRAGLKKNWNPAAIVRLKDPPQLFAFARSQLNAIGYNASLQGGLLNRSSVYTIAGSDIQRLVLLAEFGISASYKNIQTNYTQSYLSKEFRTGMAHQWGRFSLVIGF